MKLRLLAVCVALATSFSLTRQAQAGGFSVLGALPDHATAVTTTPVAIYTNPGALHAKEGLRLFLDSTLASRRASFKRTSSDKPEPADAKGANVGKATLKNTLLAPILTSAYTHGRIAAGIGLVTPFGGAQHWDKNDKFAGNKKYPGAVDGQARWFGTDLQLVVNYLSGGLSFLIVDGLSIGIAGNIVFSNAKVTQALTPVFQDNLVDESRAYYELSGISESVGIGMHWEAIKDTLWLGLSYQSPPGGRDGMLISGKEYLNIGMGPTGPSTDVYMYQKFPDIVQWGVRYRVKPEWELRLSGNYQNWSVTESQCLKYTREECKTKNGYTTESGAGLFANWPRNWHDTFGMRLAGTYFLDRVSFFSAFAYDGTAISDAWLDPSGMDGHDLSFALGARYALTERLLIAGSLTEQYMLQRDNRGKSKTYRDDDAFIQNRVPSANGIYNQNIILANVNMELAFTGL